MTGRSDESPVIEGHSIMRILPHRYPVLLVDRVLSCSPGGEITGLKSVTACDPLLSATEKSLPHLIVVEALAQLSVVLAFKSLGVQQSGQELVFFAGIEEAKFGRIAGRGDRLMLRSKLQRMRRNIGWFQATASVDDESVVALTMIAAVRGLAPDNDNVVI